MKQGDPKKASAHGLLIKGFQNIIILAYTNVKQWPINNIKVKCLQLDLKVFDIF